MSDDGPTDYQASLHQYGHAITWIVLVDINIILAVLKYNRIAALFHMINGLCILFTTYFFILWFLLPYGFTATEDDQLLDYLHAVFGCAMLGFIMLIVASGLFTKFYQDAHFSASLKNTVKKFHRIFTYTIIVIFKANCLWNWYEDTTPFTWFVSWQIVSFLVWVYLKFFTNRIESFVVDGRGLNMPINEIKSVSEIKELKMPYVIYNQHIYNASQVLKHHPGGKKVIQSIVGREVDRFLYGMYSSELCPQILPHSHSLNALKLLKDPILKIVTPNPYKNFSKQANVTFQFKAQMSKASQIYIFGLLKQYNQFEFTGYQHVSQLGQFYSLTMNKKITRLYTAVNFITRKNINLINEMIPSLKYSIQPEIYWRTDKNNKSQSLLSSVNSIKENLIGQSSRSEETYLPLIIKKYNTGRFTSSLLSSDFQIQQVELSQPKGLGLQLQITEPGKIVIVAGGTGLFPFSDLIDLLFKSLHVEQNHHLRQVILNNNPILKLNPFSQFSFLFLAAINDPEDIHPITREQILYLTERSSKFKAVLRMSKNQEQLKSRKSKIEFTNDYFTSRAVKECSESGISRVWICGPPKMNTQTAEALLESGIARNRILLL